MQKTFLSLLLIGCLLATGPGAIAQNQPSTRLGCNGYAFVFEKDNLHVYPPAADILPLVKKKLGLL